MTDKPRLLLLNNSFLAFWIKICQICIWPVVYVVALLQSRNVTVHIKRSDIDTSKHHVLVANHGSMRDPFLILRHLPFTVFTAMLPYRFFTWNKAINSLGGPLLLYCYGCFPAKEHSKYIYGLQAAELYKSQHQSIMIFPEGKLVKGQRPAPRRGVSVLANQDNVKLIPIKVTWDNRGFIPRYDMIIGKPIVAAGWSAENIMDYVYSLK